MSSAQTKDEILQAINEKLLPDDFKLIWWFAHSHRDLTVAQAAGRIKADYDLTTAEAEFVIMHFMARRFIHV
ncbi:TPA: hypothetical protein ACIAIE_001665 [Serratia fonticola]